ncbi:Piso0_001082 [Millerozyma farinosa CBS 7064]|uniref:Piso0_001082 protein n=1 Tax=Pichia sorbitophila (strain ATCC MYA-4447 / BCRC 22081 / CBS 7064 / NBRC 10061 / NRRL Y-12695) TaxID=559304 RepID=G8YQW0_PICSO|nr:Piso0_001082 [Millerozyma farinosa CBS 7064]CCE79045.1 Piso0_001082 [Millerozyma farinosa CBS 7064]
MKKEVKGFHILPLRLPGDGVIHYLFFKKHETKNSGEAKEESKAIFFCNLPVNTTIEVFKKFMGNVALGSTIESYVPSLLNESLEDVWIDLGKLTSELDLSETGSENGGKLPKNCGIVNFIDRSSLQLALSSLKKLSKNSSIVDWPLDKVSPTGSAYLISKYKSLIVNPNDLTNEVARYLEDFDAAEKKSVEELQRKTQLVDEDGFTLVVGSHRKTKAGIMGKQRVAATVDAEKAKNKIKKKEKEDFYRFQLRQRKKDEMNELLRKFKQDQEKVRLMKEKKRFRPL